MRARRNDLRQISKWIRRNTLKLRGTGAQPQEIKIFAGRFRTSAARQVFHQRFRSTGRFGDATARQRNLWLRIQVSAGTIDLKAAKQLSRDVLKHQLLFQNICSLYFSSTYSARYRACASRRKPKSPLADEAGKGRL
jgi:hypothetical protein